MRFLADEMLGKLARWLRMAGLDVSYYPKITDEDLLAIASREGRLLLTRDTRLVQRLQPARYLFISHDHLEDQFEEFLARFPEAAGEAKPLSRCAECNTPLQPLAKEKIKKRVWSYVYQTQDRFTYCPTCDRVYWPATHVERIRRRLKELTNGIK